ncbi:MAG TPA: hypothetical protein VLX28_17415 [Thermoanaerobaculia bacterium]|nr:hypothetical protein [Thermoanaerobaculia bacterium]
MNPDVARAILELAASGALPAEKAPLLLRVARGELLSVHGELRALLYAGVLLITGGAGLLVKENLDRIGPVAIAAGIGLAAAAALAWVIAKAPPFSWEPVTSPHLAFDYILLLGVLLTGADLAYIEWKFTPLGAHWPWHLLIMAVLAGVAAFRFDSRVIFSLALSTFAAWRGVSVARLGSGLWDGSGDAVRWNAIACGVLFAVLGFILARTDRKAHFEPVAVHLGWLLVLGGIGSGIAESGDLALRWGVALLLVGAGLAAGAFFTRRFPLFAYGVLGGYVGLSRVVFGITHFELLGCFWFSITSIFLIIGLLIAQRRMREPL